MAEETSQDCGKDSKNKVVLRLYQDSDYQALLDLFLPVWGEFEYKQAQDRFKWQYFENPNNTDKGPFILVTEKDGQVIGMLCGIAIKLKVGETIHSTNWIGDYMVHPDHRGGSGRLLAKTAIENSEFISGFPVSYTLKLWKRAGGFDICKAVSSKKIINHQKYYSVLGWSPLKARIGHIIRTSLDKFQDILYSFKSHSFKIEEVTTFDKRFDDLWSKASKGYKVVSVRDSVTLNFRFTKCPHLKYKIFSAVKDDEVLGYIVVRQDQEDGLEYGFIVDVFADADREDVISALFKVGINHLKENKVEIIKTVLVTELPAYKKALKDNRFNLHKVEEQGMSANNIGDRLDPCFMDPKSWFLTRIDSDLDIA